MNDQTDMAKKIRDKILEPGFIETFLQNSLNIKEEVNCQVKTISSEIKNHDVKFIVGEKLPKTSDEVFKFFDKSNLALKDVILTEEKPTVFAYNIISNRTIKIKMSSVYVLTYKGVKYAFCAANTKRSEKALPILQYTKFVNFLQLIEDPVEIEEINSDSSEEVSEVEEEDEKD